MEQELKKLPKGYYVYLLKISVNDLIVYKIGFSTKIKVRLFWLKKIEALNSDVRGKNIKIHSIECLDFISCDSREEALSIESYLLTKHRDLKYIGDKVIPSGNSELFHSEVTLSLQSYLT